jgi:large exoprotein involved in heme utilization and adhesion
LEGGLLSAPGGLIELGSITSSSVAFNSIPQGFAFSYLNTANFGNIQITQRALASTRDLSSESGGAIQIQGKQVSIRDGSLILIQNRSNQTAGNIAINATQSLQIIGKSPDFTSSSSLVNETISSGAAGNIIVTTPQLNIDGGGYIFNRTFSAAPGGNIAIITASSQFNVSGTVQINNIGVDPNSGLVELPTNVTESSQQITTGCSENTDSSFVATLRGGMPQNPTQEVRSDRTWSDIRDISGYRKTQALQAQISAPKEALIQATSWHRNAQGKIELVADIATANVQQPLTCAAATKN